MRIHAAHKQLAHLAKRKVAAGTLKVTENDDKIVGEEDTAVMRGAHAIVFVVDPTKKWTFDYVIRELPKVPSGLSTLLLVRFQHSLFAHSYLLSSFLVYA